MKKIIISVLGIVLNMCNAQNMAMLAQTPPMGWNSFDSYSCHLYEELALKELDVFIEKYAPHGYSYFVIDNGWFAEHERIEGVGDAKGLRLPLRQHAKPSEVRINGYGLVQPSKEGFPNGFKPLVDKLHAKGLKFGVHIMRGIPRKAVEQNTPIKGTNYRARDIANVKDKCGWCAYMYGVDMSKPGAQEFYNSLIQQFADWGVDFIKVDDVTRKPREIEAFRRAIDNCGRSIILSLSPGGPRTDRVKNVYSNANMFRLTGDVWDKPASFKKHLEKYKEFREFARPGLWPDLDMLPLGELCLLRRTQNYSESRKRGLSVKQTRFSGHKHHLCKFNKDQKAHFLGLRSIGSSPLMIGGSLVSMDDESFKMMTNPDFIACNQNGIAGKIVHESGSVAVLASPKSNTSNEGWIFVGNAGKHAEKVTLFPKMFGFEQKLKCQRIWEEDGFILTPEGHTVTLPAYGGVFMKYITLAQGSARL